MKNNLFIPRKIKVGFQNREGTYTKKLAYIIYYDEKGVLRKETSWQNWRDKSIPDVEYDNEPTEGFVLNKKVGGYCYSHFDARQTYVRIFDPRGFEFEITVSNLLYILENTNSIKGKGLEGEFVYSWDGKDLVLMPVDAPDYAELMAFNNKKYEPEIIKAKDLIIGATYLNKNREEVVYLGRFNKYGSAYLFDGHYFFTYQSMCNYSHKFNQPLTDGWNKVYYDFCDGIDQGKYHWFEKLDGDKFDNYYSYKIFRSSIPKGYLIEVLSEEPIEDYPERYEKMQHDPNYSPIDYDADQYEPYESLEQFENGYTYRDWYSDINGEIKHYRIHGTCVKDHYYVADKDESMTIKEIYDKYHPRYLVRYLENGKEYKRYV